MMVNLLDDSNFHRQTAVMTRLIEMIIQNPVFGISGIISMLVHSTSQCLMSFTNIQKSTECTFYAVNDIFSGTVQRVKRFGVVSFSVRLLVNSGEVISMPHVIQVLFLSVFILQVVMHGEESHVP
jgi:hypothetical protein